MSGVINNPGNKTPKSRKGVPNKATQSLREMLDGALKAKGGQKWIEEQMDINPGAVLTLLGKTLPRVVDVKAEVTGDMQVTTIQRTIVRPDK